MSLFKKILICALLPVLALLPLSGCTFSPVRTSPADGTWYEQDESTAVITIENNRINYKRGDYIDSVRYSPINNDTGFELVPEEDWIFLDIFYDAAGDVLTLHDLPHTDGDGGYHLLTFARTSYVSPPPPVYGERTDSSDPDAPKEFSSYDIKGLKLEVTEPWRDNGDMAQELPDMGSYSYELTVSEDGKAEISSDFCRTVDVTAERLSGLVDLLSDSALAGLNGVDIMTEGMPDFTQSYELDITFSSGETFHSRANGSDVSDIWETDGRRLHRYLFEIFMEAGYQPYSGEFHSTGPMMRIGPADGTPCSFSVQVGSETLQKKETSYDYRLTAQYPVFTVEGNASEGLVRTLNGLSEHFRALCEEDLAYEYPLMESVPEKDRNAVENPYAYSFYATTHEKADDTKYYFWISEGHVNGFGLGRHGPGDYKYARYCLDAETGELLSLSDFFTDTDALFEIIMTMLEEHNGYNEESAAYLHSDEYRDRLMKGLTTPEPEGGIGFEIVGDGIALYVDESFDNVLFYPYNLKVWYEDIQDILNEKYAEFRSA